MTKQVPRNTLSSSYQVMHLFEMRHCVYSFCDQGDLWRSARPVGRENTAWRLVVYVEVHLDPLLKCFQNALHMRTIAAVESLRKDNSQTP